MSKSENYNPGCCDCCKHCKIQHVKRYMETYWKCRLMKFKECYDKTIPNFSVMEHMTSWCPLLKKTGVSKT